MCGIAGFIDFNKKNDFNTLKNMTDVLHHRGPDDSGYSFYSLTNCNIGLGHRRLSILDLSKLGHQPMQFQDLVIVYNGEVYNFKEIRTELEKCGYKFESNSDTEVILKAYHKWGIEAVHKFNGMFAITIYDKQKEELVLIRDRAGVKPLYYYHKDGLFMFASELKSFHKNPYFEKEIDINSLGLFLQYGYILEPYSIFKNTYKLRAGHCLIFKIQNSKFKIQKYWDVIDYYNKPKLKIGFEEAKEETKKLLKQACEYRMVSDVPVGIFLSGGYDSSTVTAVLQKNRTKKLKTFTIGFKEQRFNEAGFAKKISGYLGTEHYEYYCTQKDSIEILPKLPEIWDEPFGDSSVIPTTLVSKLAKQNVKVSLSADGGDEVFGGYDKYTSAVKFHNIFSKIPFRESVAALMKKINPNDIPILHKTYNFDFRYRKIIDFLSDDSLLETMNSLVMVFDDNEIKKILKMNSKNTGDNFDLADLINGDELSKIMAIDYKTYLADDILVKVDRATMSVSLEGREPLLDHKLSEFIAQLPASHKINNGEKKFLLKSIAHELMPKELLYRPKMGFSIPLKEWFGNELKKYVLYYLSIEKMQKVGLFNIKEVERLKKEWLRYDINVNKIWLIMIFMMWYERWIEQ